jgi:hypothetical protein
MDFNVIQVINDRLTDVGHCVQRRTTYTIYRCFSDTAVEFSLRVPHKFELLVTVDLLDHTVYLIDYHNYDRGCVFRWTNSNYTVSFANELFELQQDPTVYSPDIRIDNTNDAGVIHDAIRYDVSKIEEDEEYETVALDLTDSELATIARAAHVKDMTINDFINEALRIELDHVMPAWREEYKNGGL